MYNKKYPASCHANTCTCIHGDLVCLYQKWKLNLVMFPFQLFYNILYSLEYKVSEEVTDKLDIP